MEQIVWLVELDTPRNLMYSIFEKTNLQERERHIHEYQH